MRNPEIWIGLIILGFLLFGAKKMPDAARGLGRSMRIFKSEIKGMEEDQAAHQAQVQQAQIPAGYQQPPAYQQPVQQPAYQPQPGYPQQPAPQPAYQPQPGYAQPAYQQPTYQQPAYPQPAPPAPVPNAPQPQQPEAQ